MTHGHVLSLLAVFGVLAAVATIIHDNQPTPTQAPAIQPPQASYAAYVFGTGLIEPSSRNIAVGTPVPGIVKNIDVKVGDPVKAGDVLFEIDDSDLQA